MITYITDYLSKGDAGLTKELGAALAEKKGCNNFEMLTYLKKVYFTHKQVSVSEATYRLLNGMCLKNSDTTCIFVTTGFPQNRSSFYQPVSNAKPSDPDVEIDGAETEENTADTVTIEESPTRTRENVEESKLSASFTSPMPQDR